MLYVIPMEGNKLRSAIHTPIARATDAALIASRFVTFDDPAVRRQDLNAKNVNAETVSDISQKPRKPAQIRPDTAHFNTQISTPARSIHALRVGA